MEIEIGKKTQIIIAILLLTGIAGAVSEYGNNVIISGYFSGDGGNITGITIPYSYVIYTDGTNYYAKNGTTGVVKYSGTNASIILNDVAGSGGTVFIKKGTYSLTTPVVLHGQTSLMGEGITTILMKTTNQDAIISNTAYQTISKISIGGLGTDNSGYAVQDNAGDITLIDCKVYSVNGGFNLSGVAYVTRAVIDNVNTGIKISGGNDQYISDTIIANDYRADSVGLEISKTGAFWLSGVDIIMFDTGLLINPAAGDIVEYGFVDQLASDTSNIANIGFTGSGTIRSIIFDDTWAASSKQYGIYNNEIAATDITFTNSRIYNNNYSGIFLTVGSRWTIINSQIGGNAKNCEDVTPQCQGIYLDNSVSNVTISNNNIGNNVGGQTLGHQSYGIYAGAVTDLIINNNNVLGNEDGTIWTDTPDSTYILNNLGKNPFAFGNRANAPTAWGAGDTYYDTDLNQICVYTTSWKQVSNMSAACS